MRRGLWILLIGFVACSISWAEEVKVKKLLTHEELRDLVLAGASSVGEEFALDDEVLRQIWREVGRVETTDVTLVQTGNAAFFANFSEFLRENREQLAETKGGKLRVTKGVLDAYMASESRCGETPCNKENCCPNCDPKPCDKDERDKDRP